MKENSVPHATDWEERYRSQSQVWSGRPNGALVQMVTALNPGDALDLGCGEGADSIWLAEHGWRVLATDFSVTALARGAREASRRGIPDHAVTWQDVNLVSWRPTGQFNLVIAAYLHSAGVRSRYQLIRKFAEHVKTGGHLLVLSHATFPPDRKLPDHLRSLDHSPAEEQRRLALPQHQWQTVAGERYPRVGTGSQTVEDNVLLMRRV